MTKREGYKAGLGKYSTEVKLNPGKPLQDAEKGVEKPAVWDDNDSPAIRGTRKGFS